jgi:hypothetical protein
MGTEQWLRTWITTQSYVDDVIAITWKMKLSNALVMNHENAPSCRKEKPAVLTQIRRKQVFQYKRH